MNINLKAIAQLAADVITAVAGDEDITIRHGGLSVTVPYAGNENATVGEIFSQFGAQVGIPAEAHPNVSRQGEGLVDASTKVVSGSVYDGWTDRKENAVK